MLGSKSPASHNAMLRQRIPHPASTNYDEDFTSPIAKRLKRFDSTDSSLSRIDLEDDFQLDRSPQKPSREIADSEADSDDEEEAFAPLSSSQTELESALPPVKTDKEAIRDYEASRAAEAAVTAPQGAKAKGWIPGRSSIYVDAFNLALNTVMEDESHLFDEPETEVFNLWRNLSYEAQYLYVRLFLRKTAAWHRESRLGYHGDIADLPAAIGELRRKRPLPASTATAAPNPGEAEAPADTALGSVFTFADGSEENITATEDASRLLRLDELKAIAKEAKLQGKNKSDLLKALVRTSQTQGGLGWSKLQRSDTEESVASGAAVDESSEIRGESTSECRASRRDAHFICKIFDITGPCIRLSMAPLKLFERVHLVFYRSTEWTEKSLTTIILAKISRRNFPDYIVSRSTDIFPSRNTLLEFEASIRTQSQVDDILEMNGTPTKEGLQKVEDIFEAVYPRWRTLLKEEQEKEDRVYESGEGAYLRRFSPAWVYTRIIHKGLYPLARFKERKREHDLLKELLDQCLFHAARRGAWYQRKALLEEHYMWEIEPSEGRGEEAQRKHWKRIALRTCEGGLQDQDCHLIYHYDLQKRISKLEKSLKVAKREQHDFGHSLLVKAEERVVEGIRLEKERPPSRNGPQRGGKTVWVDEREGGGECSVEAMCLSWYRGQGWKGFHSEGSIVRTLFGLLFHDILFTYCPNVFQTPFQACPLDLHTDAFYPTRASEINHRLAEISNGSAERIFREAYAQHSERKTCIVGIDWNYDFDDLLEIIQCFRGEALAVLCKTMAQEYQARGGGIPDLFLWRVENDESEQDGKGEGSEEDGKTVRGEVCFAEVKSENDRLSDTQRLWIHVLVGAGVKVELCKAVASEVRVVR